MLWCLVWSLDVIVDIYFEIIGLPRKEFIIQLAVK